MLSFIFVVRLFGPLFAHIKARVLIIEDTPIATIEDYVFYGMNNTLEKLHLVHSNLSKVGPLGFGVSDRLTDLHHVKRNLIIDFILYL